MLIFDAHLDLAWNALDWNRNLDLPVHEIRQFEQHLTGANIPGENTVSWADLRRGRVATMIATLLPRLHRKDAQMTFFQSREAAYGATIGQAAYYQALVRRGELKHILDAQQLREHYQTWTEWEKNDSQPQPPLGYLLSMEGSWGVLYPELLEEYYELGLRILGPAHYGPDPYCHGTGSVGGLKADGPKLLKEMDRLGIILDVTHLSDDSFWQAVDIYQGPLLASHHNSRTLVPGDRQLTDEQLKLLIERNAVIGASFDNWMIKPGWVRKVSDPRTVVLDDIVTHIDYICQLAGNARHCGIGSDLDGGFGKEQTPWDLDTIADLQKMAEALEKRGYSQDDIRGILGENWINYFLRVWG